MDEFRQKGGKKAATVAITANCILTVLNIVVGIISGSYALVSEGAHTLSDVATSVIAYIGFYIGQKPADDEHPIGHGRAEAISGLVIVIFLVIIAWEIMHGAVEKILNPSLITVPSTLAAIMAVVGILVNLRVSEYIINLGKQIKSPAIVADGKHQKTDIVIKITDGIIADNNKTFGIKDGKIQYQDDNTDATVMSIEELTKKLFFDGKMFLMLDR